jgi:hypothetical protein
LEKKKKGRVSYFLLWQKENRVSDELTKTKERDGAQMKGKKAQ